MDQSTTERNTSIVAAISSGVSLKTVCSVYGVDAMTVRRAVEAAGQAMPIDHPGPRALLAPRESEMLRRALDGEEFSLIGRDHGVSREWIRQVVKTHTGLSARDLKVKRDAARHQFKVQRVLDSARDDPMAALDDLAGSSGLSVREVESVLGPAESARRRRERLITTSAERSRLLGNLRRVAELPSGTPLSGPFYDRNRGDGVSAARLVQIFGTWAGACEEAGVEARQAPRTNYTQSWSEEDCLRWVHRYLETTARPTFAGYGAWARAEEGAPSSGTVRLRAGKWITTVRNAYALAEGDEIGTAPTPVRGASTANEPARDSRRRDVDVAPPTESPQPSPNTGQRHQQDAAVRLHVEMAAQHRLMDHYRARGWTVVDTHADSPFDAKATRDDETHFLEAKGTQSAGAAVFVTRGEVDHARAHPGQCFMGIWSGIAFSEGGGVDQDSGDFKVIPFSPSSEDLVVVTYEWRLT